LLFSSENYIYHTLYADILYTLKQYEQARQYYSQSVELNPTHGNIRAYYGILMSVRAAGQSSGIGIDMYKLAMSRLINIYKYSGNDMAYNTLLKAFEQSV
jgi:tetratricopeptide (TPR) repeat protein